MVSSSTPGILGVMARREAGIIWGGGETKEVRGREKREKRSPGLRLGSREPMKLQSGRALDGAMLS